jgi:hypothetical protein
VLAFLFRAGGGFVVAARDNLPDIRCRFCIDVLVGASVALTLCTATQSGNEGLARSKQGRVGVEGAQRSGGVALQCPVQGFTILSPNQVIQQDNNIVLIIVIVQGFQQVQSREGQGRLQAALGKQSYLVRRKVLLCPAEDVL